MTLLDIIVVGIIGLSGLVAVLRGMLQETFSLIGWTLAAVATLFLLPVARPYAREWLPISPNFADIAAGAAIFIVVLVIVTIISANIVARLKSSRFGTLDRSLGLLYGLLRGYLLAALLYMLLYAVFSSKNLPDWVQEARTRPVLEIGAKFIVSLTPKDFLPSDIQDIGRRGTAPKQ